MTSAVPDTAIKSARKALRSPVFKTAPDDHARAVESAIYRMNNSEIARCYLRLIAERLDHDHQ